VGDRDVAVLATMAAGPGTLCSLVAEEEAAGRWLVLARPDPGGPGGEAGPCEWTIALQSQARARASCASTRTARAGRAVPWAARMGAGRGAGWRKVQPACQTTALLQSFGCGAGPPPSVARPG
jgi:hypothetical protein